MADNNLYWQRIGERQDATTLQAREASPVTVQVPKTGQQLVLERSFQQGTGEVVTVELTLISDAVWARAENGVWAAGLLLVLAFRFAVLRLRAWVEVLLVALFLGTEVVLELASPVLAGEFLKAGVCGIAVVAIWTASRAAWRRVRR
jgi:hypothetical protein